MRPGSFGPQWRSRICWLAGSGDTAREHDGQLLQENQHINRSCDIAVLNRPISLNRNPARCSQELISSSSWIFLQKEDSASSPDLRGSTPEGAGLEQRTGC